MNSQKFKHLLDTVGEYGTVEEVNHPIIFLRGLPKVSLNESIVFEDGSFGLVTSFTTDLTQVLLLSTNPVAIKSRAVRTNQTVSIPLSDSLRGQTINPLSTGQKTSSKNKKQTIEPGRLEQRSLEKDVPNISLRSQITRQIITGLPVIDLMLPLSHGQRAVLIGDQQTGKKSFLLSASQQIANGQALVIYAAIGKHWQDLSSIKKALAPACKSKNAIIVSSNAHDAPGLIYLTPFTAMTIAEYFKDQGQDVFVVFDDLSTHAKAYRELSLLGQRFPGRESYPGDMFFTHARLLERAGSFIHSEKGGVCITALAAAETIRTSFSPIIVSNLISITDGHLLFDASISNQGRFPAIDFTLSISRVGHKTQPKALKKLGNKLSILLSNYLKTERYAHFSAELTPDVQDLLTVGSQLLNFLSQDADNHFPLPVQAVFATMIWQKWLKAQSAEDTIIWRDNLAKKYSTDKATRDLIDSITRTTDLDALLEKLNAQKDPLLNLCRTAP
jgi:F-type H+/Na+-transporting ATPase subunit alpha